jgi:predicted small metal-binding protein
MAKTISCRDVGPDCAFTASAETEEELMQQVAVHASEHGIMEVTPELLERVKAVIKDE